MTRLKPCRMPQIYTTSGDTILRIPDSKTGAKIIRLNEAAMAVLSSLPRLENNPYVIVGNRKGRCLVNIQKPWARLRKSAGLEDVRLHDLRHSFASIIASGGGSLQKLGSLLGHSNIQTTMRYAHLFDDPVRELNEQAGAD
ncbi:MAG TPA: site-specific integrase, partial [Rhizobiales bacterium]|nr:site-specific integrase [Hyphomicrobiales bacterium]